jgi:hypothetical protein
MYEKQGREICRCSNVVGLFPPPGIPMYVWEQVTLLNIVMMVQLVALMSNIQLNDCYRMTSLSFMFTIIQLLMDLRTTVDINSSFLYIRSLAISEKALYYSDTSIICCSNSNETPGSWLFFAWNWGFGISVFY